jgi:ribonuclease HI
MPLNPTDGLLCYTDGAYSRSGAGGWAWVAVDLQGSEIHDSGSEPPPTTNNRMELIAQIKALQDLYEMCGPCEIEVVSDSKYVILGCEDRLRARNVNQDLWVQLDAAVDQHTHVQWRHVNGHNGVKYNELVDELAVKAKKGATWI